MSSPSSSEAEPPLFKCVSNRFYYIPRRYRVILGQFIFAVFGLLFLIVPFNIGILFISISLGMTKVASIATAFLGFQMLQFLVPCHEWPIVRSFFQICYDAVDFSTNLDDARRKDVMTKTAAGQQYILAMHPHAIIPLHALLWAAYCDQYLSDKTSNIQLYGFGAVADVVLYLPFLRTILGWLSVSSATYSIVRRGLVDGKVDTVPSRNPRNLYILPGGIAEVFTSQPGKQTIVFKERKGLCKLALEAGAALIPTYVFGATDFYHSLITADTWFSRVCRRYHIAITLYWGPFHLPIPYFPRLTMCCADPIYVTKSEHPTEDQVNELHDKYLLAINEVFDKYKGVAGYPDAILEVK